MFARQVFVQVAFFLIPMLLLAGLPADAQQLYIPSNVFSIPTGSDGSCATGNQLEEARDQIDKNLKAVVGETLSYHSPVSSCSDGLPVEYGSGYYWRYGLNGTSASRVYCDMERTCCNSTGGWMRVANLDMTDPNAQCPSGFEFEEYSQKRVCGRDPDLNRLICTSTIFSVHGVEYSRVCGRVIGYQYKHPDAFEEYYNNSTTIGIDDPYLDGMSLTHGSSPRKHIWSFVAAQDEVHSNSQACPCTRPDLTYTGVVPPFVGEDYFCETGSRFQSWRADVLFFSEDPLWDGQGCGEVSTCCDHPLYFCKQLEQPTSEDIELRLCNTRSPEDTPLEIVELYVQ